MNNDRRKHDSNSELSENLYAHLLEKADERIAL